MVEHHCPVCGAALEIDAELQVRSVGTPVVDREIEELDLIGVRAYHRLRDAGVRTIGDLTRLTVEDLRRLPGFGAMSIAEVREALAAFGLSLSDDDRRPADHSA